MSTIERWNPTDQLNRAFPAAKRVNLGTTLQDMITKFNALLDALDADTKTSGGYVTAVTYLDDLSERT